MAAWLLVALATGLSPTTGAGPLAAQEAADGGNGDEGELTVPEGYRVDGEYGLWVRQADGRVEVRWLTRTRAPGFLEVRRGERTVTRRSTPAGASHRASFRPPRADSLVLRYGARSDADDVHRTVVYLPLDPDRARTEVPAPDTLFVIGDVHGEHETLTRLLGHTGIVDGEDRWSAGGSHLVFLGDLMDRGSDVTRTLWYLYGLEHRARAAGGRVHLVLGNHEVMVWTDDLRYTSAKERLLAQLHGVSYPRLFDVRTSVLGQWLVSKPALLKVGDVLLAHGGLSPAYLDYSLEAFDDSLARYTSEPLFRRWSDTTVQVAPMDSVTLWRRIDFFMDDQSVFWYRGYVQADTLRQQLHRVLERHDVRRHVVAHTPLDRVTAFYGGDLIDVDLHDPATELLMLVRQDGAYRPYRWALGEDPEPLPAGPSAPRQEPGPADSAYGAER